MKDGKGRVLQLQWYGPDNRKRVYSGVHEHTGRCMLHMTSSAQSHRRPWPKH